MSVIARIRVESNGQLRLPEETQEALGIRPGSVLLVRPIGASKAEIEVLPEDDALPTMTLREMIARFASDEPYDDTAVREAWEAGAGEELADRIRRGIE
jgi:bifunctional DNA-binding transcriptional regulator/antitoxin component of YhaV-PrlF toxin-antitoxin module